MKAAEIIYRYALRDAPARPLPKNAIAAQGRLDEGSRAFAALLDQPADETGCVRRIVHVDARDLGLSLHDNVAPKQRPFAAILGCSDARAPIELIFNEGPNDLFVVRVAGNGLGADVLGSLTYAIEHLGGSLKLFVVLGHSGCGAVSAAVDAFQNPAEYLPLAGQHSLRNILDRLLIVVQASARKLAEVHGTSVTRLPGYREALIETAIVNNAALASYTLRQELTSRGPNGLRAVFGIYLLETHQIWAPRGGGAECIGLAEPPRDLAAFLTFGDAVVRSDRIVAILNAG